MKTIMNNMQYIIDFFVDLDFYSEQKKGASYHIIPAVCGRSSTVMLDYS